MTGWRVLERFGDGAALLEVALETGRTHQIRVHLAEAGHPLLADAVYGGTRRESRLEEDDPVRLAAAAMGRQALHAWRLAFAHPRTGKRARLRGPAAARPGRGAGHPAQVVEGVRRGAARRLSASSPALRAGPALAREPDRGGTGPGTAGAGP